MEEVASGERKDYSRKIWMKGKKIMDEKEWRGEG